MGRWQWNQMGGCCGGWRESRWCFAQHTHYWWVTATWSKAEILFLIQERSTAALQAERTFLSLLYLHYSVGKKTNVKCWWNPLLHAIAPSFFAVPLLGSGSWQYTPPIVFPMKSSPSQISFKGFWKPYYLSFLIGNNPSGQIYMYVMLLWSAKSA